MTVIGKMQISSEIAARLNIPETVASRMHIITPKARKQQFSQETLRYVENFPSGVVKKTIVQPNNAVVTIEKHPNGIIKKVVQYPSGDTVETIGKNIGGRIVWGFKPKDLPKMVPVE